MDPTHGDLVKTFSDLISGSIATACAATFVVAFLGAPGRHAVALGAAVGVVALAINAARGRIS